MVQALVGNDMKAATKACAFCETKVYDVRFKPVRGWSPYKHYREGGWCARCWRSDALPNHKCLLPDPEWAGDEQAAVIAKWEAEVEARAALTTGAPS